MNGICCASRSLARGLLVRQPSAAARPGLLLQRPLLGGHYCARPRASGPTRATPSGHPGVCQADEAARALPGIDWGLSFHGTEDASSLSTASSPVGAAAVLLPYSSLDAIVVLAGGQTGPESLPEWVERRLDAALSLQRLHARPCPVLLLGGGTPHKGPYLDSRGFVIHESSACAAYLVARGADPATLLKEVSSYDTVGNAYFSLTIHALPAGWRRVAVVTSDFHMPRTASLFDAMFELLYVATSDAGVFEPEVLQIRKDKEAAARLSWLRTASGLTSLRQLHAWLHDTHLCYAVRRQHEFGVPTVTDPKLLASY
ncbi:hypothetical protein TSOC_002646 [Tetrabaena socialis]|uniref:DUF218 domain-containing protein n=1 Tax=Tetrabaena socialis TaxID=47790 RepID=A0A2J8ADM3_9CHLO|nr:hypothetical protein TSOC_002646 [Tetrabaena socialis]|eukprot:PNH10615.1 hypothetical protein TSOC_002646 [Tetrabaena socialis]